MMKKIYIATVLTCLLAGLSFAGYWQMETHLPQGALDDMAVTGLSYAGNTMIAVIGGSTGAGAINDVYYYEIGNQNWHGSAWGVPQYPHPVYGLAAVTVPNGTADTIYPCGGYLQDLAAYGDSVYYPLWMSGWYPIPGLVMQKPRMNHGLVAIDHDLYAVGGTIFGGAVDSTVEILRLNGGTVSGATPMPQSRTEAVVVKALGADGEDHIYVIGGRTNSGALLNSVVEYDTSGAGGFWNGKTSMPGPGRWMATGAVLNNKIYVMGGAIDLSGNVTRRVDIYDPQANTWTPGDSLPLGIIRAGAYGVNNVIYFFGGFDKGMNAQTDSVWQYHALAPNSPPLVLPQNNVQINDQSPVFVWRAVPAADGYRIQVTSDPTFMTIDVADYAASSGTDTTLGGVSLAPAGYFYWRVKAYNWSVPDSSLWSPVRRLTLDLTPPDQPIPSQPADGYFTNNLSNVYFYWFPVDSIMSYHLQVFKGDTFTPVYNIYDHGYDYANLDFSMYGTGQYLWRVEAKDSAGNFSGYHSIPTFTIDQTAPLLTFTYPFSGNVDIDPNDDIILGFSEPMNQGTFSFSCSPDPGNWTYTWSTIGDTVYIGHAVFPSGTTITASINTAQDLAGNNFDLNGHANPWNFTTITNDVTPPNISVPLSNSEQIHANNNYTFQVNITDPGGIGVDSAVVRWATAGYNGYNFARRMFPTGITYQAYIYGNEIGMQGVQYQVEAWDSAGNSSLYPGPTTDDYYIHSVRYSGQYLNMPVPYDVWQMISIPSDARGANIFGMLSNDLTAYDPKIWRLFEWVGGGYNEISLFGNGTIYDLGQAYWLRHRWGSTGPITVYFEGVDSSFGNFTNSTITQIALQPGWTDVGTPFQFNIPWANVPTPGLVAGPYIYNGSAWQDPAVTTAGSNFSPFKGYSYRNDNSSTVFLDITPSMAKKKNTASAAFDQPAGWQAWVNMENSNGQDHNRFGVGFGTSSGRDQYDYPEPPSGLTGCSGYFRMNDDQFCTDIRPELGEGQTWDFAVDCKGETKLTISLPVEFPAGTECYLADLSRQVSVNIKDDQAYSFTPEPGEKVREFKIIAGQADYAKGVLGSSFALPAATLLLQNRPNPLRDNTSINYQLSADGPVKLAVYNVAGQMVKTLVNRPQMAGRYTVSWNGRDESGRRAATGVYFYRLTANGKVSSRTMNLIK